MTIEVPEEFICPITHSIMRDPVMNRQGVNYEKRAIQEWMHKRGATDPLTREPISPRSFISNRILRARIETYCLYNAVELEDEDEVDPNQHCVYSVPLESVRQAALQWDPKLQQPSVEQPQQRETQTTSSSRRRRFWRLGKQ